jgi:hypothetical protein
MKSISPGPQSSISMLPEYELALSKGLSVLERTVITSPKVACTASKVPATGVSAKVTLDFSYAVGPLLAIFWN